MALFWIGSKHEWISDTTRNLPRAARLKHDSDQYKNLNRQCKKSARQDKQNLADANALQDEAELARDQVIYKFHKFERCLSTEIVTRSWRRREPYQW